MKKILLTLFFCMASIQLAGAAVFFEGMGGYTTVSDADNMYGFGVGAGIRVTDNINFFIRGVFNSRTNNPDDVDEEKFSHMMMMGSIEYIYHLPTVPFAFTGFFSLGYTETEIEKPAATLEDSGVGMTFGGGVIYLLTQHISPILTIGYHRSFYQTDLKSKNIGGFQILLGVRATIFGRNKPIDQGY